MLLQPWALVPPVRDIPALAAAGSLENCRGRAVCLLAHAFASSIHYTGPVSRSQLMKPLSCTAVLSEQATPLSVGTWCVTYLIYSFRCSRRHSL